MRAGQKIDCDQDHIGYVRTCVRAFQFGRRISRRRPASSKRRFCSSVSGMTGAHWQTSPCPIHSDKSEMGGGNVPALVLQCSLQPRLYSDFHRGVKDPIHRGTQNDERTDAHGDQKVYVIDRGGHHVTARMTVRSHGAREIDPVHEPATEERAERIRIVRQDEFSHLRLGIADSGAVSGD